jgi:hypothetical protein
VTSAGATVTQNFLVVSMETKHDEFNHNPSPIVAMGKKSLHLLVSSTQKGVTQCRIHIVMPTNADSCTKHDKCSEGNLMSAHSVLLNMNCTL